LNIFALAQPKRVDVTRITVPDRSD